MTASTKFFSSVPDPALDLNSLHETTIAIKSNVEVLTRQRKPRSASAVTWDDLLQLGLISADQIPKD